MAMLGGSSGVKALGQLPLRIMEASKNLIKLQEEKFKSILSRTKLPYSSVIQNIAKVKKIEKKVNGKLITSTTPIHLVKPSLCIEAVLPSEKQLLKSLDTSWDAMTTLYSTHEKGVHLSKITEVRKEYKNLYNKQIEIGSKLTAWKAQRRAALTSLMSIAFGKKAGSYQDKNKNIVFEMIRDLLLQTEDLDTKESVILSSFCAEGLYQALGLDIPSWCKFTRKESLRSSTKKIINNFNLLSEDDKSEFKNYMGQISIELIVYYEVEVEEEKKSSEASKQPQGSSQNKSGKTLKK